MLNVNETLKIDGTISVNGADGESYAGGGGSGGSIEIHTRLMQVKLMLVLTERKVGHVFVEMIKTITGLKENWITLS